MIYRHGCVGGFQIFSLLSLIQKRHEQTAAVFDLIGYQNFLRFWSFRYACRVTKVTRSGKNDNNLLFKFGLRCRIQTNTRHKASKKCRWINNSHYEASWRNVSTCKRMFNSVFLYICLYWNVNVREYFQQQRQICCLFRCQAWEQVTVLLFGRSYERVNVTSLSDKLVWRCFILMSSWFGASWRNNVSFKTVF